MNTAALVEHLHTLLRGEGAHQDFMLTVQGWPPELRGRRPAGAPHSAWQLVEHLRIAQWDILHFCRSAAHFSPRFPDGYWPEGEEPPDGEAWDRAIRAFADDLASMQALVASPGVDLFARIPWGDGQTLLREALVLADHNSYHLGQLVLLRKQLGLGSRG
jgi:hypothetical protein